MVHLMQRRLQNSGWTVPTRTKTHVLPATVSVRTVFDGEAFSGIDGQRTGISAAGARKPGCETGKGLRTSDRRTGPAAFPECSWTSPALWSSRWTTPGRRSRLGIGDRWSGFVSADCSDFSVPPVQLNPLLARNLPKRRSGKPGPSKTRFLTLLTLCLQALHYVAHKLLQRWL